MFQLYSLLYQPLKCYKWRSGGYKYSFVSRNESRDYGFLPCLDNALYAHKHVNYNFYFLLQQCHPSHNTLGNK
jgi:hypothetical protein